MVGCAGNAPAGRDARWIYSPPRLFNGLTALKWNPVLELHQRSRLCKPPPVLLGQWAMTCLRFRSQAHLCAIPNFAVAGEAEPWQIRHK